MSIINSEPVMKPTSTSSCFRIVHKVSMLLQVIAAAAMTGAAVPTQASDLINPADCAVNQLAASNSAEARIFVPLMRALDAFMAQAESVSPLREIYWSGSAEIVKLFKDHPQVFAAAKAALVELQPAIAAYLAGKADQFIISQSLADKLSAIYDLLWLYGGEALKPAVTKARQWFNSFNGLAGKSLAEVGPGFGFAPLNRPFLHLSGPSVHSDALVLQANYVEGLSYSLWRAPILAADAWSRVNDVQVKTDGLTIEITGPHSTGGQAFYQIRAETAAAPIALPDGAENAFEFIDKSNQEGFTVRHYGYLTHIAGLVETELYSDPVARNEKAARLTFAAETVIRQRHTLGTLIQTAADGAMTIYFNDTPAGDFDLPQTFSQGRVVAKLALKYSNTLTVLKENEGINAASISYEVQESTPFTVAGRSVRWADTGVQGRIEATGPGFRTVVEPLAAFFYLSGHATVTQR